MAGHPQIGTAPIGIDLLGIVVNDTQGPSFYVVSKSGGGTFQVSSFLDLQGNSANYLVTTFATVPITITYYLASLTGGGAFSIGPVTPKLGDPHTEVNLGAGIFSEQFTNSTQFSTPVGSLPPPDIYALTASVSVPAVLGSGPLNAFTTPGITIEIIP